MEREIETKVCISNPLFCASNIHFISSPPKSTIMILLGHWNNFIKQNIFSFQISILYFKKKTFLLYYSCENSRLPLDLGNLVPYLQKDQNNCLSLRFKWVKLDNNNALPTLSKWDEEVSINSFFQCHKGSESLADESARCIQKWFRLFPDLLQSFGFSYDLSMGFSKAELFLSLTFRRIKLKSCWRLRIKFKTAVKGPFLLLPCH